MWKSKFYGAFVLNHRVVLHAIDVTPARWRGDAGSSPLDRARTAASSPRNDLVKNCRVHPTHWLISTQVNEITKSIVATNPLSVKVFVTDKEREALIAPRSKGSQKKSEEFFAVRKRSLSELADRDIVIVTYNTMQAGGPYAGRGDVNPCVEINQCVGRDDSARPCRKI